MEDRELLLAWHDGDQEAGRELFERQYEPLTRFFSGKVPHEDVGDMVQQTLLSGLRHAEQLRDGGAFRAYLFRIARNALISRWRKQGTRFDPEAVSAAEVVAADPSPSQAIDAVQRDRLLLAALRRLPVDMQILLELHYWEGMLLREIGEVVQLPLSSVKSQMHRARQRLRELIPKLADSPEALETTLDNFERWSGDLSDQVESGDRSDQD